MTTRKAQGNESLSSPTGISGLDDILRGGLPRNRLYLVEGDPGVGKTTFALQFLLAGASRGESALYITLSETKAELESVAKSHDWSLDGIVLYELSAMNARLQAGDSTFFHPSELELNQTTQAILDKVDEVNPQLVVFDSLSELRLLSETPLRYRRMILSFKQHFSKRQSTVLLLDDRSTEANDPHVRSLAHGVLLLEKLAPEYGVTRRRMRIEKVRGLKFREGNHDFVIETGRMEFFPRLIAAEHHVNFPQQTLSSGIRDLDSLLGGGLDFGTSTIVMGPAGTGKSTLAMQYAISAAKRGQKSAFFLFDEGLGSLLVRAKSIGMDLERYYRSGDIHLQQVDPADIAPGELVHKVRHLVEQREIKLVGLDSLNGYFHAMPGEKYLQLQLHELFVYLNQRGLVTIAIMAQHGLLGPMQSQFDLSYLADTVLLLRFFEAGGEVKQAISILKKRTGRHERTIREFKIESRGLRVGGPLHEFHGILTGTPTFTGASRRIMKGTKSR